MSKKSTSESEKVGDVNPRTKCKDSDITSTSSSIKKEFCVGPSGDYSCCSKTANHYMVGSMFKMPNSVTSENSGDDSLDEDLYGSSKNYMMKLNTVRRKLNMIDLTDTNETQEIHDNHSRTYSRCSSNETDDGIIEIQSDYSGCLSGKASDRHTSTPNGDPFEKQEDADMEGELLQTDYCSVLKSPTLHHELSTITESSTNSIASSSYSQLRYNPPAKKMCIRVKTPNVRSSESHTEISQILSSNVIKPKRSDDKSTQWSSASDNKTGSVKSVRIMEQNNSYERHDRGDSLNFQNQYTKELNVHLIPEVIIMHANSDSKSLSSKCSSKSDKSRCINILPIQENENQAESKTLSSKASTKSTKSRCIKFLPIEDNQNELNNTDSKTLSSKHSTDRSRCIKFLPIEDKTDPVIENVAIDIPPCEGFAISKQNLPTPKYNTLFPNETLIAENTKPKIKKRFRKLSKKIRNRVVAGEKSSSDESGAATVRTKMKTTKSKAKPNIVKTPIDSIKSSEEKDTLGKNLLDSASSMMTGLAVPSKTSHPYTFPAITKLSEFIEEVKEQGIFDRFETDDPTGRDDYQSKLIYHNKKCAKLSDEFMGYKLTAQELIKTSSPNSQEVGLERRCGDEDISTWKSNNSFVNKYSQRKPQSVDIAYYSLNDSPRRREFEKIGRVVETDSESDCLRVVEKWCCIKNLFKLKKPRLFFR